MAAAVGAFSLLSPTELKAAKEIVKNKLYFVVAKTLNPRANDTATAHFFCIDTVLLYGPFFGDFGPLNLGCTYRFCMMLKNKLKDPKLKDKVIYFYCSSKPQCKANAACLIGLFQVLYLNKTPADAYKPLKALEPFLPFRDASMGPITFKLTIPHVLSGVAKALKHRFFDFTTFNAEEYEFFEAVENGDLNIILPGRFLAFSGPHASKEGEDGFPAFTPEDYVPIFKKYGVTAVVRLNKKCYERERFTAHGFQHFDLFFNDGTPPPPDITEKFLHICETVPGTIAVHCKAGLGRTGSLIGCYLLKHYHFTAAEAIAWLRVCRPGSVIGPQQQFLKQQEARLWKAGGKPGTSSGGGSSPGSINGSAQTTPEKAVAGLLGAAPAAAAAGAGAAAAAAALADAKVEADMAGRISQLSLDAQYRPGQYPTPPGGQRTSVAAPPSAAGAAAAHAPNGAAAVVVRPVMAAGSPTAMPGAVPQYPVLATPSYAPAPGFRGGAKVTPPKAGAAAGSGSRVSPKSGGTTPPSASRKSPPQSSGHGSARGAGPYAGAMGVSGVSPAGRLVNSYMTKSPPAAAAGAAAGAGGSGIKRTPPAAITTVGAAFASPSPVYKGGGAATAVVRGSPASPASAQGGVAAMSISQPLAGYNTAAALAMATVNPSAPVSPGVGGAAAVAAAYGVGAHVRVAPGKGRVPRKSTGAKAAY